MGELVTLAPSKGALFMVERNDLCCSINPYFKCEHCGWILCKDCGEEKEFFKKLVQYGDMKEPTAECFSAYYKRTKDENNCHQWTGHPDRNDMRPWPSRGAGGTSVGRAVRGIR